MLWPTMTTLLSLSSGKCVDIVIQLLAVSKYENLVQWFWFTNITQKYGRFDAYTPVLESLHSISKPNILWHLKLSILSLVSWLYTRVEYFAIFYMLFNLTSSVGKFILNYSSAFYKGPSFYKSIRWVLRKHGWFIILTKKNHETLHRNNTRLNGDVGRQNTK